MSHGSNSPTLPLDLSKTNSRSYIDSTVASIYGSSHGSFRNNSVLQDHVVQTNTNIFQYPNFYYQDSDSFIISSPIPDRKSELNYQADTFTWILNQPSPDPDTEKTPYYPDNQDLICSPIPTSKDNSIKFDPYYSPETPSSNDVEQKQVTYPNSNFVEQNVPKTHDYDHAEQYNPAIPKIGAAITVADGCRQNTDFFCLQSKQCKRIDTITSVIDENEWDKTSNVFDINMKLGGCDTKPLSPTYSTTESSDRSSCSAGSSGLKDLLLLPTSYTELSIFQKKYFPTNDYAENTHLNRRINNKLATSTSVSAPLKPYNSPAKTVDSPPNAVDSPSKAVNSPPKAVNSTCCVKTDENIKVEKFDVNESVLSSDCVSFPTEEVKPDIKFHPNSLIKFEKNSTVCEVCDDKAAGFYCGAFICEACKKFFLRAAKLQRVSYMCLKERNCKITKENRVQCQYCRYMKCVSLKMFCPGDNPDKTEKSNLPCQVCSAASSGFHFGAITCEGCKGFFRRMARERISNAYICSRQRKCRVTKATRNSCKACRYQRCIEAGMSVTCCRIGRQPNAVKHALSIAIKDQSFQTSSADSYPSASTSEETNTEVRSDENIVVPDSTSESSKKAISTTDLLSDGYSVQQSPPREISLSPSQIKCIEADCYIIIDEIKMAAKHLLPIITHRKGPSSTEVRDIFKDHKTTWNFLMSYFEFDSNCVIRFSKKIPGFRTFSMKTQVSMIQLSCYPIVLLLVATKDHDWSSKFNFLNILPEEHQQLLSFFPPLETVDQHLLHIGTIVNSLSLDYTEVCLMTALLLTDEENVPAEERVQMGQIQEKITECLRIYEEDSYDNGAVRYGVILLRLGEFSLASLQYGQTLVGLTAMYPDLEYPQIFQEMLVM
ncbi:nuclear receptor subfamily 2 group C member 1 [Patella vulgata]|uniref:nuclear receptor subfamily 2 group C member 1 n=1 Tax=Patella vulgata TaxID=6465 RepID=UPI0024A80C7C|nr:nuclear receptor subfamily 2 group C member 1 [Patella vulgata]XP_050405204.2 nuclear receptor subfamily 2 group C member 1 [Patella vulgata]